MSSPTIRPMKKSDLGPVGTLAAELVRQHHRWDADRFLLVEPVDEGYRWFFGTQLGKKAVALLVAELDGEVVGYAYGTVEKRDWNALLDEHGALHDVAVDARYRRHGIGRKLVAAMLDELRARGATKVVLHSATQNAGAQALFESLGFRRTMVEMTWSKR
ncbi:MAG: GNAT family N-acetyltransferase [Myxococcota bacterium]